MLIEGLSFDASDLSINKNNIFLVTYFHVVPINMKIAVKFSPPNNYKGGSANTFSSFLIKSLNEQHKNIHLFTENPSLFSNIEGLSTYSAQNPLLKKSSLRKITSWIYQQLSFENELVKEGIDVLYCPYNYEALLHTRKIPQVITVHDLIPLMWQDDFKTTSTLWKYVYIPTIKNAKAIITVSENTKQDILNFCNISHEKVFVVYNGYSRLNDSYDKSNQSIVQTPYILYVSSSHYPYKNLIRLLEAYYDISQKYPHRLVIVGKSNSRFTPHIKTTISDLNLSKKIFLLENLSDIELSRVYQGADLFVYPSLYEGFGIPPLEAMSYDVPVIASNAASIPEVCGDAALYVEPKSIKNIVNAIDKGLNDIELRQMLILAGRERVKKFSWEKTANGILEVCKKQLS